MTVIPVRPPVHAHRGSLFFDPHRRRAWTGSETHRPREDQTHAQAGGRDERVLKQLELLVLRHGESPREARRHGAPGNVPSTPMRGKRFVR